MKIKTYYLILVIVVGFFSASIPGQVELPPPGEESLLISQPYPAFAGIDKLYVVLLRYGIKQDKDVSFFKHLEINIKEKLHKAGIKLDTPTADNILTISELRIYLSSLNLEDSRQHVFHIRTTLARAVCLKDKQNPIFKADIWQATPVMQAVSAENMPAKVTDVVLEQVEDFINIHKTTNPNGKQLSDDSINETDSSTTSGKQVDAVESRYIASKNSNIFHKPECRWARNISQRNLVGYSSKDEAIKAGKRPCKTCNP